MMFRNSSHDTTRVSSSRPSKFRALIRRFRLPFALAFIFILALGVGHIAVTAGQVGSTGNGAFELKADKFLKQVRRAAAADREDQASGIFRAESSRVERLSEMAGLDRKPDNSVTVSVAVILTGGSDEELKAAGFPVQSRVGDVATLELDVDRLTELAALATVRKMFASVYRHPVNDRARQAVAIDNSAGQRIVSQTGRG